MSNITIGRYHDDNGAWSGWIEGSREDGSTWITYLDETGSPTVHYSHRDATGAVIGEPVLL